MDGLKIAVSNNAASSISGARETLGEKLQSSNKSNAVQTGESFADNLKAAINTVDKLQKDADTQMQNLATGRSQNIHETMIAAEKADLALRLMVQVRNKVIEAYQDIMKMQV
jgi:flagellar hook-basal body complex protein FliE